MYKRQLVECDEAPAAQFFRLQQQVLPACGVQQAAVVHQPQAAAARAGARLPVDGEQAQPGGVEAQAQFLGGLAQGGVGGGLAALDDAAREVPVGLVDRVDEEDPVLFVEEQDAGGDGVPGRVRGLDDRAARCADPDEFGDPEGGLPGGELAGVDHPGVPDQPAAGGAVAGQVFEAPGADPFAGLRVARALVAMGDAVSQDRFFWVQHDVVHRDPVGGEVAEDLVPVVLSEQGHRDHQRSPDLGEQRGRRLGDEAAPGRQVLEVRHRRQPVGREHPTQAEAHQLGIEEHAPGQQFHQLAAGTGLARPECAIDPDDHNVPCP